jgi:general secretion pathway protein A
MYEKYYGLKEKPFNILPDPDYLFMSQGHENTYTHLEYAIMENKGFVVVTGEIGSGKTTLLNYLIGKIQQNIQIGLVNQTYVTPTQFIKMVCQDFEIGVEGMDKAEMVNMLHEFLLNQFAMKERVILIIDEAQNLSPKTMEELRMLSNLEAEKHHLIQMILVGQPELKYKLQRKDLVQFAQRVTVNCHLDGLRLEEVEQYIEYRLKVGGSEENHIFNPEAIKTIFEYTRGIPRLINVLCDAALVYGFADKHKTINKKIIENVVKEREDGGLFTDVRGDNVQGIVPDQAETTDQNILLPQFSELERRLRLIENRIDGFEQRLSWLAKQREDRDTVVIELFKMLKDSMEKRVKMLMSIKRSK